MGRTLKITKRDKLFRSIAHVILQTHYAREQKRILDPRHNEKAYPDLSAEDLSEKGAKVIMEMKRGVWRKYKKSDVSKLKEKLFELVKKICRDLGPCIAAGQGRTRCGGYIQASHILSEGEWKNLFIDPQNIYPMCYVHHFKWWHRDVKEAAAWFMAKYPKENVYLDVAKRKHIDFNDPSILNFLFIAAKQGYGVYSGAYAKIYDAHAANPLDNIIKK